jgi:hypothetical protein
MAPTTNRAANRSIEPVAPARPMANALAAGGLNINRETGLCTDYLNHFSEAIMLLEMFSAVPESIDDLLAWRPRSYIEHFAASNFRNREAAIACYHAADPRLRQALDQLADTMNTLLTATRDLLATGNTAVAAEPLAESALAWLKPLLARADMVIHGRSSDRNKSEASAAQTAVDALFVR